MMFLMPSGCALIGRNAARQQCADEALRQNRNEAVSHILTNKMGSIYIKGDGAVRAVAPSSL